MENIDQCTYDLILHDLIGNGWIGTYLEIYQDDDNLNNWIEYRSCQNTLNPLVATKQKYGHFQVHTSYPYFFLTGDLFQDIQLLHF